MTRRLVFGLLAVLLLGSGCNGYYDRDPYAFWDITVDNRTGIALRIELDGDSVGAVATGTILIIPNVRQENHVIEALDADGRLRGSRQIYLDRDFVWILE
jgi:hypothetical protein